MTHYIVETEETRGKTRGQKSDERLSDIINYIESNYFRDVSLQELSEKVFLSSAYLSKYLKNKLGVNFIDYVNSVRLHYCIEDLLYTDKSILIHH